MPSLLGIDSGLTVTKAVLFDIDGTQLSVARRRVEQLMPRPRFVERDMAGHWAATAQAIREAIAAGGRAADDIKGVAATAHGDGLYLLDQAEQPLGPGILSLDSRTTAIMTRWTREGVVEKALALTGQPPHVSAESALLAWIKEHEPDRFSRIGHILSCKDWLRFCLSGTVGTDRTEASIAFTDVHTQDYSREALELFGLGELRRALPPVSHSAGIVGGVTAEAARLTGLKEGTPVAAGLHDVTASSLGIGGHRPGTLAVVAGTYSINEVVSSEPHIDPRWSCRNAVEPGQWHNMAISPASAANYDWFLDTLCAREQAASLADGSSIHVVLGKEITAALARSSTLIFHPFLFGSPFGDKASASFVGLRGWHRRGDMLKAVLEGIAFNHRTHVDALRDGFTFSEVRLTGGASRNAAFAQMFADVLDLPVTVTETDEAAAFGAALCAGTGVGLYASVQDDPRDLLATATVYQPDKPRARELDRRFHLYNRIASSLQPLWPEIESLAETSHA